MKIVLFQPEIPQNTGNIIRTCAVTGSDLILVEPLGFSFNNRWLKRAGLDYVEKVNIEIISSLEDYLNNVEDPFYFFSSKATQCFSQASYDSNAILIFGSETSGLPLKFHEQWKDQFLRIPMINNVRCLNLATSVGIAIYQALHQQGYKSLC
ncbi:MAG: tRNA (uridine(34)/cytosine(34)/5-carboxymethylaminomethyluridine (34)-2'-O)-methyltransferase TrmL [Chlamydiales bacterium]